MLLPLLVARDWDKKNPDLGGKEQDDQLFGGGEEDVCKECGKPLDEDDEKKYGKH